MKKHFHILIMVGAIIAAIIIVAWLVRSNRPETVPPDGYFSEEQAAARLATLEAAQKEQAVEIVPMKFFTEEIRPDIGTFAVTAVTTMPEDTIADVSFHVSLKEDPEQEIWYEGENKGNGYYLVKGSAADLGHREGIYIIQAFVTPVGGSETEAGSAEVEMSLADYFYSEALGGGRQSLVLVHPSVSIPEKKTSSEEADDETAESDEKDPSEDETDGTKSEEEENDAEAEEAGDENAESAEADSSVEEANKENPESAESASSGNEHEDEKTAGSEEEKQKDESEAEEEDAPEVKVIFKVWPEEGGQEDLSVYEAEETEENIWKAEISLEEFINKGDFVANAYAVIDGEEIGIASASFELLPEPTEIPEGKGHVVRKGDRVFVEVPEILQNPELPTGCESVALTIVLSSMGYELEKTEIAKEWLPRGDNLATSYVGDPFSSYGAGCFPPAIADTASKYLIDHGDGRRGHNITGSSIDELCEYIENGTPVIMWSSSYMAYPTHTGNIVTHRGQEYEWYSSEHCLVLYGYDKEKNVYLVSDPLVGLVERDMEAFEKIYNEIGKYAVVIY